MAAAATDVVVEGVEDSVAADDVTVAAVATGAVGAKDLEVVVEEGAMAAAVSVIEVAVAATTGATILLKTVAVPAVEDMVAIDVRVAATLAALAVLATVEIPLAVVEEDMALATVTGAAVGIAATDARAAAAILAVPAAAHTEAGAKGVKAMLAAIAVQVAAAEVMAAAATGAVPAEEDTDVRVVATLAAATVAALAAPRASRERTESALENDGIRWISVAGEKHVATLNFVPGNNVYGEKLVKYDGEEYRLWDPFRSKLAGSLKKGLKKMPIQNGTKVLYLGASTGTTVSHVSDIVGNSGIIFAVEPATRVARDLIENVASKRKNVVPVLEDARRPQSYFSVFGKVDVVYCDVAQPDQTDIAIANCNAFLKPGGVMLLLVKTQSIDVTRDPNAVIAQEAKKLEKAGFTIEQILKLEPFDKDHGMIYCVK